MRVSVTKNLVLRVTLFFCVAAFLPDTFACSCLREETPCEAYGASGAVFIGHVIGGTRQESRTDEVGNKIVYAKGMVRFAIEQPFFGVRGKEAKVSTFEGTSCGYGDVPVGERYIVYASGDQKGGFFLTTCNRTRRVANAEEDMAFLLSLEPHKQKSRLYGGVGSFKWDDDKNEIVLVKGISEIKITAEDPKGRVIEAATDETGNYEFSDLKPNTQYRVKAKLPDYFEQNHLEKNIKVSNCGCARIDFYAVYDGGISGRVIDFDGNPVERADVALVHADEQDVRISAHVSSDWSDKEGKFALKQVPPGRYLLGVNITVSPDKDTPYASLWYPGVADRAAAIMIEVEPGQKFQQYDLQLKPKLRTRTIQGVVTWPNGQPAKDAAIWLMDRKHKGQGTGLDARTDERGQFTIEGYEGIKYWVIATAPKDRKGGVATWDWFYAEPPSLDLDKDVTGLRLVLTLDRDGYDEKYGKPKRKD